MWSSVRRVSSGLRSKVKSVTRAKWPTIVIIRNWLETRQTSKEQTKIKRFMLEGPRPWRVPNRFFGIRDLAYFTAGIRDFWGKGERDSGL